MEEKIKLFIWDFLFGFFTFIGVSVLIMGVFAKFYAVEGSSMTPTLHNGERLVVEQVSYRFNMPQRGDIIVFRPHSDPWVRYIKRIVGIPGDTVVISDGRIILNREPLGEDYLKGSVEGEYGPYVVPPGEYFVLGDNRNNSEDSRFRRVGFVSRQDIVGRAVFRYWPFTRMGTLERPLVFEKLKESGVPALAGAE